MRRLNLLWMALLGVTWASMVPACSDNETEQSDAGAGGSSGNGGSGGAGPTSGQTNTTGIAGGNGSSDIGLQCESSQECQTGLECLTSRSNSLNAGGPAHGFCSFQCGDEDTPAAEADAECQKLDPNSVCHYFDADTAYCVQRCTFGVTEKKCQGRDDVVCDVILHESQGSVVCTSDNDCDIGDRCLAVSDGASEGVCFSTPQVCLPRCNSEEDCPPGRFCDPRSGQCVDDEPMGKQFDEPCDPDAEVDECAGICASDGFCVQKCIIGTYPACGSTSEVEGTADCFFAAYEGTDLGDVGLCGALCDCTDDCRGDLECIRIENMAGPFEYLGRTGFCGIAANGATVLDTCDGSGGSGGMAGSSGGGAAGEGGSP